MCLLNLIVLLPIISLARAKTVHTRGVPWEDETERSYIPFSTKYPDQIITDSTVCLPRVTCPKTKQGEETISGFWTDLASGGGSGGGGYPADAETPYSGPVDLPLGAELPDSQITEDDQISAVVAEYDNVLIEQSENACPKDRSDYCGTKAGPVVFTSKEHTMCKYCGLGGKCPFYLDPAKNDLTGRIIRDTEVKELIVQLHNEIRSKIARGACDQPKAGCMGPLVWDDELARVAQKWADQCMDVDYKSDLLRKDPSLFHDAHPQRKIAKFGDWRGVGQNIARNIAKGSVGNFNATSLVGHWFKQIKLFDPRGVLSFGSGDQCGLGVGYYTQLVWENTTHVGCGWTQFQYRGFPGYFENFLVCNYGPAANIWKEPVYTVAETTCDCPCVDCDQSAGMCPANPRYGTWSSWGEWGRCTRSCGGGERDRKRACTAPSVDGKVREPCPLCKGEGAEAQKCNIRKCPVWTSWTPWSECSVSCGVGDRKRQRVCGEGNEEKGACPGEPVEYESCAPGPCPAWTAWTPWTSCSLTCGGGKRRRLRECGVERSGECIGDAVQEEQCNTQTCPTWSDWSPWTQCSLSCGAGRRTKVRECLLPKEAGSSLCQGEKEVTELCNTQKCPDWTDWTEWTPCTRSCGGGSTSRQRECIFTRANSVEGACQGEPAQTKQCNTQDCPVWTDWSEWGECSVSCGGGLQSRARECVLPRGVEGCSGSPSETRQCKPDPCPVWTEWTDWTACTATCNGGTRFKVRDCVLPAVRGVLQCPGPDRLTEQCNQHACPALTSWGAWTDCSVSCGGGIRYKRRECVYPKDSNGNDCRESLEEKEACNEQKCPEFGDWSAWTECTKTCGGGTRRKVRECIQPRGVEGCRGEAEAEESCNPQECPVWTDWTEWTRCSASCGGGRQRRNRDCVLPETKAYLCTGDGAEERDCNTQTCPDWTDWTEWTQCTKSCGRGTRTKLRECVLARGLECLGEGSVTESCNTQQCPVWTDWTEWTRCTQSCGGGKRTKVRECVLTKSEGGCEGEDHVSEDCNTDRCPAWTDWTEWTECSASCGGGRRRRSRECVARTGCEGQDGESEACNEQGCPGWSPWSEWSNCTEPCGGGFRERERECLVDGVRCICEEDKLCSGNFKEGETCNEEACPEWTPWSPWSSCSVSCGEGTQARKRTCRGKGDCVGQGVEERPCKERSCVSWTPWGPWTPCSTSCGRGRRDRSRSCGSTVRYLDTCPGDERELENCDLGACSTWLEWGGWSQCSGSCGQGARKRGRTCSTSGSTSAGSLPPCPGPAEEREACQLEPCRGWSEWAPWGECSRTCGEGTRQRERSCSQLERLGLLLSPCPGSSQESGPCNTQSCSTTTQAPAVDCGNIKVPEKFSGFNGKPAQNIADCSWDYFTCTKRYGEWPENQDCCMARYKQCCMIIMGTPPHAPPLFSTQASAGYGPDIDIDLDIDLGFIENPIDDINLGNGTGIQKPAEATDTQDIQGSNGEDNGILDNDISQQDSLDAETRCARVGKEEVGLLLPHLTDCTRFISCQRRSTESWIANPMSCPEGTGFDPALQTCNYIGFVKRCNSSRRSRILIGW